MLRNLLLYRLVLLNLCGVVITLWCWQRGYVAAMYEGDSSRITLIITGLFLVGLVSVFVRAVKVSRLLNKVKGGHPVDLNGAKLSEKAAHIDDIPGWLTTLGLLGTVIGFFVALNGVGGNDLVSASGVQKVTAQLMGGMRIALTTTIIGAVFGLWLEINRRVLKTATVTLIEDAK